MDADEPATLQTQPARRRPVLVRDPPVRLFHWLVVVLVTSPWARSSGRPTRRSTVQKACGRNQVVPPAQPEPASGIATKRIFR